jgi:hypothetical protein
MIRRLNVESAKSCSHGAAAERRNERPAEPCIDRALFERRELLTGQKFVAELGIETLAIAILAR